MLVAAYLDGETSPGETIEIERRLAAEPALRRELETLKALSGSVRRLVEATPVPAGLLSSVSARLGAVEGQSRPRRPVAARGPVRRLASCVPAGLPALAASLVLGLAIGGGAGFGLSSVWSERGGGVIDAVYAGHLRALSAPQPFDVASSDRHVVKPWFNGRTAIAPDAPDLAPEGFPLVGGRVDVVGTERVPTVVYKRRQHVISVTALPRTTDEAGASRRREGSNIVRWDTGDLSFYAVSDLNAAELAEFVELFRARTAPRS